MNHQQKRNSHKKKVHQTPEKDLTEFSEGLDENFPRDLGLDEIFRDYTNFSKGLDKTFQKKKKKKTDLLFLSETSKKRIKLLG